MNSRRSKERSAILSALGLLPCCTPPTEESKNCKENSRMKIMVTWNVRPGAVKEAVNRFLITGGSRTDGLKLLGRWHKTDSSCGLALYETDNQSAVAANSAFWTDVLETHDALVIEDAEMAPVLARYLESKNNIRKKHQLHKGGTNQSRPFHLRSPIECSVQ